MGASSTESDSSGNGYHLTALNDTGVVAGIIKYARYLTGVANKGMWSGAAASAHTPSMGEWTAQFWVYWISHPGNGTDELISLRPATNVYPADNATLMLAIDLTGKPFVLWQINTGVGEVDAQTFANSSVQKYGWTHITMRKKLNGSNYDQAVFVNGVLDGQTLNQVNATGGTNPAIAWCIGTIYPAADNRPHPVFYLDETRIQKAALSDAQIKTDYLTSAGLVEVSAPTGHTLDGNTFALYRFDDASGATSFVDATGLHSTTSVGLSAQTVGKFGSTGYGRKWSRQVAGWASVNSLASTFGTGEWTVEFWMLWDGVESYYGVVMEATNGTGSNSLGFNLMMTSTANWSAYPGSMGWSYMNGAAYYGSGSVYMTTYANKWVHVACRKKSEGGGTYRLSQFVNGVEVSFSAGAPNTGAAPTACSIGGSTVTYTTQPGLGAILDDMRVSAMARSDAEILASYQAGVGTYTVTAPTGLGVDSNTLALWRFDDSTYGTNISGGVDTQAANSIREQRVARPLIQSADVQARPSNPPLADLNSKRLNGGFG